VSSPELDAAVEAASEVSGVLGARMTGGGFGGCIVCLVRCDAVAAMQRRVSERFARDFAREPRFFVTRATVGAEELVGDVGGDD
jgi:galactokinase